MASIIKVQDVQNSSGNNIINESSDTITIGASGDTINIVGTLQNNGNNAVGITMADSWRINADVNQGTDAVISTNWERNDTSGFSQIGTGLTESSGVFSFPQTGIYLIISQFEFICDSTEIVAFVFAETTINNSTYTTATLMRTGDLGTGTGSIQSNNFIFDVTDISNCKFRFLTNNFSANTVLVGTTTYQRTGFSIFRLGDT